MKTCGKGNVSIGEADKAEGGWMQSILTIIWIGDNSTSAYHTGNQTQQYHFWKIVSITVITPGISLYQSNGSYV